MPLLIGLIPLFARHATDAESFAETTFTPMLGSGPYAITDVKPGESLLLRRRSDYWADNHPLSRGLYHVDEIKYDFYRDTNALFEAFKAGLVDYRVESDPTRWATGYSIPAVADGRIVRDTLKLQSPKGMSGLVFNTRKAHFADIRVREALGLLFDFSWTNRNLFFGLYKRADSFFADSELSAQGNPPMPSSGPFWPDFPAQCGTTSSKDAMPRPIPMARAATARRPGAPSRCWPKLVSFSRMASCARPRRRSPSVSRSPSPVASRSVWR